MRADVPPKNNSHRSVTGVTARALALALLCLTAACAAQTVWVKEDADAEALRRDRAECNDRGQDYKFIDDRRDRDRQGSIGADIYRSCMEARGWRRQRGPAK